MRTRVLALVVAAWCGSPLPARGAEAETFVLALAVGYSSPLADPYVAEGFGGGVSGWIRLYDRLGWKLALDVTDNAMEGELESLPWPYTTGDIVTGPSVELTPPDSVVDVRLSFETGAYWTAYVVGLVWSWGLDFGGSVAWHITDYLGVQLEARYHLYNLAALEDQEILCPRTLRPAGLLDRFDLFFALVVTK